MGGPDHAVFDRMAGQEAVVEEVRARLKAVERGADGGEDAHTFFFYGFPGARLGLGLGLGTLTLALPLGLTLT